MLLFYGKNLEPFFFFFCNISIPTKTGNSYTIIWQKELQHHIFVVHIMNYANWNLFVRKSKKHTIALFWVLPSAPSTYHNIYLHVTFQWKVESIGWNSSKNNRKEKGNGSWEFMTCIRLKMYERRRKKVFSILARMISFCTIRGAGSLSIFLEGSGPTIQKYCTKIKMNRSLIGFANIYQGWFQFRSKYASRNEYLWERFCKSEVVLVEL